MLEAFVSCLKSYAKHLKSDQEDASHVKDPEQQKFGTKELVLIPNLVRNKNNNASVKLLMYLLHRRLDNK
jgi:hypothetical protein